MSKQISGKGAAGCENDADASTSASKRKSEPEIPHLCSKERKLPDDWNRSIELNDLCDNVIDLILCHLQLEDLANIADTNTRLRSIACSIFSRKHSHRIISIDVFHYVRNIDEFSFETALEGMPFFCKHEPFVRISDASIWFKLMRNFGASIKFIRIQGYNVRERGEYILRAPQNVMKYVTEFCSDSVHVLELVDYSFFTLDKPLTNLQEFFFIYEAFEPSALELMPNLRSLYAFFVPRTLEKHYEKLERVKLQMENDQEVESFISFLQQNRQIKHLTVNVGHKCRPEYNDLIYSSIAENLTQLTTLKIYEINKPTVFSTYRFQTVESFSFRMLQSTRSIAFEFTNLRKFKLDGDYRSLDWLNCIVRNKGLKVLKFHFIPEAWLKQSIIRNLLSELSELEQIIVFSSEPKNYSILKNILGREWNQIEKKENGRFKTDIELNELHLYKRFQKKTLTSMD